MPLFSPTAINLPKISFETWIEGRQKKSLPSLFIISFFNRFVLLFKIFGYFFSCIFIIIVNSFRQSVYGKKRAVHLYIRQSSQGVNYVFSVYFQGIFNAFSFCKISNDTACGNGGCAPKSFKLYILNSISF